MKIRISPPATRLALFALLSLGVLAPAARATTYQADTTPPATYSDPGRVQSGNAGWTGTGYYNFVGSSTSWIQFAVSTANTGSHTLTFRYANGLTGPARNMPIAITVDNISVGTVPCPSTGVWTTWADQTMTVSLTPGNHTVRATSTNADGGPNIDKLDLTGGTPPGGNTAPTISNIADQSISVNGNTGALAFTVGDAETAAGSLTLTKGSSNTTLVPTANIVFGGSGANRTVTVTPVAGQTGTATITVTVSDGSLTASDTFVLTVNAGGGTPNFAQIGWSTLNGGTTGGKFGGSTVLVDNVDTFPELKAACESTTTQTIRITGDITSTTNDGTGRIVIKSNKSIIGAAIGGDITRVPLLQGVGFQIIGGTTNIIIRNLKMTLKNLATPTNTNSGDVIQIYGNTGSIRNIWIDHCEFFQESALAVSRYDGLLDVTFDVSYITISWCYFHDAPKGTLMGQGTGDAVFNRRATMHHNRWENMGERAPRYNSGEGHVYNSWFKNLTSSCINLYNGAKVRVEGSVFENSDDPVAPKDSSTFVIVGTGTLANQYTNCTGSQPTSSTTSSTIPYTYTAEATSTVKQTVIDSAGAGKIAIPIP
jgi:pectate lyase